MNQGLHQQLASKRADLKANTARAKSTSADPRDSHEAGERVPWLKREIDRLELEIALGNSTLWLMNQAMKNFDGVTDRPREMELAATALEMAIWMMGRHVGEETPNLRSRRDAGAP